MSQKLLKEIPIVTKRIGRSEFEACDIELRELLKKVMARCRKSREQIAEEMTVQLCRKTPITKDMLDDLVGRSEGKARAKFPAAWVAAFCEVTGDDHLRQFLLSPLTRMLLDLGRQTLATECEKNRLIRAAIDAGARKEGR